MPVDQAQGLVHYWLFPGKSFLPAPCFTQTHPECLGFWCWDPDGSQESNQFNHVCLCVSGPRKLLC